MLTTADIHKVVEDTLWTILDEDDTDLTVLTTQQTWEDVGLSSLGLARLVVQLEKTLRTAPFSEGTASVADVRTIGDMAEVFERAAGRSR